MEDAPWVQALAGAAEVAATALNLPHPYPEGAAALWIDTHAPAAADGRSYTWAIVRAADAALLGAVALNMEARHARGRLGYWLEALLGPGLYDGGSPPYHDLRVR